MTKIKICGIKTIEEARSAHDMGADYLGLLVDIPKTNLSLTQNETKTIVSSNPDLKFVILTLENNPKKLLEIIQKISPWGVQLLRPTVECLESLLGKTSTKIIPVVHVVNEQSENLAKQFYSADFILLDSKMDNQLGGTGKLHDWNISKKIIENSPIPIFLAGGLNEENVLSAIVALNPFAVDVESSLRNAQGFRDLNKVKNFINKVKS